MKEETYIGHSVHNKQSNISFKNKEKVRKPQEEWYRVENTHEAIISEEVFQKVQELIAKQTQATEEWHNADIFRAGKMCGLRMVIGLWCKQPEQKSLCTLPLQ